MNEEAVERADAIEAAAYWASMRPDPVRLIQFCKTLFGDAESASPQTWFKRL